VRLQTRVGEGSGVLETQFGDLPYQQGDYLVIHRHILHRFRMNKDAHRLVIFESKGYIRTPRRYRNEHGQLGEGAPYSERDIRIPRELRTHDQAGDFQILVKQYEGLTELILDHHPCDVVGWDGFFYPWAFNINDFEPIVGRIHQPPPVHQTFQGDGFVICSFCPRPYDFDPNAIPAPYNHSNVDSDEVLFYASEEFMSRHAPSAQQAQKVAQYLRSHGFVNVEIADNRMLVSGNIELNEVNIAFKTAGRLIERTVDEGADVKKGQVLARLDRDQLTAQRERETAGLASSESQLTQAQTALEWQKATLAADLETRRADLAAAPSEI